MNKIRLFSVLTLGALALGVAAPVFATQTVGTQVGDDYVATDTTGTAEVGFSTAEISDVDPDNNEGDDTANIGTMGIFRIANFDFGNTNTYDWTVGSGPLSHTNGWTSETVAGAADGSGEFVAVWNALPTTAGSGTLTVSQASSFVNGASTLIGTTLTFSPDSNLVGSLGTGNATAGTGGNLTSIGSTVELLTGIESGSFALGFAAGDVIFSVPGGQDVTSTGDYVAELDWTLTVAP